MPRQSFWCALTLFGLAPLSVVAFLPILATGGPSTRPGACLMTYNDTLYFYSSPSLYSTSLVSMQNGSADITWEDYGSHELTTNGSHTTLCAVTSNGYAVVLGESENATSTTMQVFDMVHKRWTEKPTFEAWPSGLPLVNLANVASKIWQGRWWFLLERDKRQTHVIDTHTWQWTTKNETTLNAPPRAVGRGSRMVIANGFMYLIDTDSNKTMPQQQYGNHIYAFDPIQRRWLGVVGSFWSQSQLPLLASNGLDHFFVMSTMNAERSPPSSNATSLLWTIPIHNNGSMRAMQVQQLNMSAPHAGTIYTSWHAPGLLLLYDSIGYPNRASFLTLFDPHLNKVLARCLVGLLPNHHQPALPNMIKDNVPFWESEIGQRLKVGLSCAAGVVIGLALVLAVYFMRQKRKVCDQKPDQVLPAWVPSNEDDAHVEDASTWSRRVRQSLSSVMLQYRDPFQTRNKPSLTVSQASFTNDMPSRFKEHTDSLEPPPPTMNIPIKPLSSPTYPDILPKDN